MTFYQQAQNEAKMAIKTLHNLMINDSNGYLHSNPIRSYLNESTVELSDQGDKITFQVGPHTFIIEPEYILFQGSHNSVDTYLNIYENITQPSRLIAQGQQRIYRLDEITISLTNNKYELPHIQYDANTPWYIVYFNQIVEYIKNVAGAPRYEIIEEEGLESLSDSVWAKIQQGWQPIGGVSTVYAKLGKNDVPDDKGEARLFYAQAVTK